jgi:hypothetical protein
MPWGPLKNSQVCAIHAALVPTADGDGEIVYFGGDEHSPPALLRRDIDKSRRMNCRTEAVFYVKSPPADLFCCGHAFLADGRLLVGGGTVTFEAQSPGIHAPDLPNFPGHFTGERRCWVYNPAAPAFTEVARFNPEPGREDDDAGGGRWYPTIITLPTGQLLALQGHPAGDDRRHDNPTPERYLPVTNAWTRLPALAGVGLYARAHVVPSGEVLFTGVADPTFLYDPWAARTTRVTDAPGGLYGFIDSSSVLLPLLPEDGYVARVLLTGDVQPRRLDLGATSPAWRDTGPRTGSARNRQRHHAGAVILPTRKVLVVGGVESPANDGTAVLLPELYDPARDIWETIEGQPAQQARNYHSSALLMPDGRVWTAGSNIRGERTLDEERRVLNFEIFTPPYPTGPRPTISDAPASVAYGQRFTVHSPQAEQITQAALVRCGSMTHGFDFDQRYVGLTIANRHGTALELVAPPHGAVAPPGVYMLFLVDGAGRPCQYARFVRVGGDMYVVTDRSHFSEAEVSTLGTTPTFYDAFYVVLDGFLGTDVGLPAGPAVTFRWADGDEEEVPGMTYRLERTLFETGSVSPGVGQKIVLVYSVRFTELGAFGQLGADRQRPVTITVRSGAHVARGRCELLGRKNPYMLDGNPHWLSVDLRVLSISEDQVFAGVTQQAGTNAPHDFLNAALRELRDRPEGATHPFDRDLHTDDVRSTLELASEVNRSKVYNYAFARVRYRAPVGQDADDVRVFFRMFTTAAASLEFRPSTYPVDLSGTRPLIGVVGGEVASLPFFAAPRVTNLEAQADPQNVRRLRGTGNEEIEYFGCWLDFNQDVPRVRQHPTRNGTGGTGPLWSLQQHIRGEHQCLVAEVRFAEDPIPFGATPGDNDNLAQRNLLVVESDNPGGGAGHRVQHTFELRPSEVWPKDPSELLPMLARLPEPAQSAPVEHAHDHGIPEHGGHARVDALAIHAHDHGIPELRGHARVDPLAIHVAVPEAHDLPDQLVIRWNDLPRDSEAYLYLPGVDVSALLEVAAMRIGAGMVTQVDAHTIGCRIGDVTVLPIPGLRTTFIPGLLSIQLPADVRAGQVFRVSVHQISGRTGKIVGAFQLTIPVGRGPFLLAAEERKLSVLRHIGLVIAPDDRWAPVWERYLEEIAGRVRAFGGDPDTIAPSPTGSGKLACGPCSNLVPCGARTVTDEGGALLRLLRCLRMVLRRALRWPARRRQCS